MTTFGPGSIVDLRDESLMMAGTDFWPHGHGSVVETHEPNLERLLGIEAFRMPSTYDQTADGKNLPALIFPRWMICPKCHRLAPYTTFSSLLDSRSGPLKCPDCRKKLYPARLVVACSAGHIDDFPWEWWVHRHRTQCDRPQLFLESMGITATLADIIVSCKTCGVRTSLAHATEAQSLAKVGCSGRRPWLGDREQCSLPVSPLQRGASNVYFSMTASSISIPPWSRRVHAVLDLQWRSFKGIIAAGASAALRQTIEAMGLPAELHMSASEIEAEIMARWQEETTGEQMTERELRRLEREALRREELHDTVAEFRTRQGSVPSALEGLMSKVMLVERLREVRALRGFTRVTPPDPSSETATSIAPLSRRPLRWLPAIEVRGEGIYLELDEGALKAWESAPAVQGRTQRLQASYDAMCARREWQPVRQITPRLVLTHSLAHALIRQLSLDSGYSSASLRERLYVFEPSTEDGEPGSAGLLIYTSTVDSEGSLGGLVRQGKPDRLAATITGAVEAAAWCSSDPLCIESEGQGHDGMNLAACHACLLLSETCCEEYNRLLDRALLTGTPQCQEMGFFSQLAKG